MLAGSGGGGRGSGGQGRVWKHLASVSNMWGKGGFDCGGGKDFILWLRKRARGGGEKEKKEIRALGESPLSLSS